MADIWEGLTEPTKTDPWSNLQEPPKPASAIGEWAKSAGRTGMNIADFWATRGAGAAEVAGNAVGVAPANNPIYKWLMDSHDEISTINKGYAPDQEADVQAGRINPSGVNLAPNTEWSKTHGGQRFAQNLIEGGVPIAASLPPLLVGTGLAGVPAVATMFAAGSLGELATDTQKNMRSDPTDLLGVNSEVKALPGALTGGALFGLMHTATSALKGSAKYMMDSTGKTIVDDAGKPILDSYTKGALADVPGLKNIYNTGEGASAGAPTGLANRFARGLTADAPYLAGQGEVVEAARLASGTINEDEYKHQSLIGNAIDTSRPIGERLGAIGESLASSALTGGLFGMMGTNEELQIRRNDTVKKTVQGIVEKNIKDKIAVDTVSDDKQATSIVPDAPTLDQTKQTTENVQAAHDNLDKVTQETLVADQHQKDVTDAIVNSQPDAAGERTSPLNPKGIVDPTLDKQTSLQRDSEAVTPIPNGDTEQHVLDLISEAKQMGFKGDDAVKRVSEWIKDGVTPKGTKIDLDSIYKDFPQHTLDRETGEKIIKGDDNYPTTGTVLDYLEGKEQNRVSEQTSDYKKTLDEHAQHPNIKAAVDTVNNNRGEALVAPEYMVNAVKKIYSTVKNVAEFTKELVARFGEAVKKHALKLWNTAKEWNANLGDRGSISDKPITQYGAKGNELKKIKDDKFIKGLKPPLKVDAKEQARLYNEKAELEKNQFKGEEDFTPADAEKKTLAEIPEGVNFDEALRMINEDNEYSNPRMKVSSKATTKNPEDGYIRNIDKKAGKAEETFEYPKVDGVSESEDVASKYPRIEDVAKTAGLKLSERSNKENDLRVKNAKTIDYLDSLMKDNDKVDKEDSGLISKMARSLSDEGYILKPILQEVFGEGVNIKTLKALPIDEMMHVYDKIMNEGDIKGEPRYAPRTKGEQLKHNQAMKLEKEYKGAEQEKTGATIPTTGKVEDAYPINTNDEVQKNKVTNPPSEYGSADNKVEKKTSGLTPEQHKEAAYEHYKKTFKSNEEVSKLAEKVMGFVEELRGRGKNIDAKAVNLFQTIQNRFSEFKGDEGARTLVKILKSMSIDNKQTEKQVEQTLLKKYLGEAPLDTPELIKDRNMALYVLGFQLREEQLKNSEKLKVSEATDAKRQPPSIDNQENFQARSPEQEFDNFANIDILNKAGVPSISMEKDGDIVGQTKQHVYDVSVKNKDGKNVIVKMSQLDVNKKLEDGSIKFEDIKSKSVNKLDVLFSNFTSKDTVMAKAFEMGYKGDNLTAAKKFILTTKINGMESMSPERIEALSGRLSESGLDISPSELYHLYEQSGYDVARTFAQLDRMQNINRILKPEIVGITADGSGVLIIGSHLATVKPNKSEEAIQEKLTKLQERRLDNETIRSSGQQALIKQYQVKAYTTLNATEKAFMDTMATRYEPGNRPVIGKMRNQIVQGFFEKIAGLFGADLILTRNADFDARYYPKTTTGKPVLAVNLDSPLSFTRLFAHELFHHVINKLDATQYGSFKDGLNAVVDKQKWEETVQRMMANRSDLTPQQKMDFYKTFEFNSERGTYPETTKKTDILLNKQDRIVNEELRNSVEGELHSELFSYATTKPEFWKALGNTLEGKSLATKLQVRLMQHATSVMDMFKQIIDATKQTPESGIAQLERDKSIRGLVKEWFDVKDFKDGVASYQGGLYELLANVLDEAYLSKTLRNSQIKNMTVVDEVKDVSKKGGNVLNSALRTVYPKGTKSYRDVMTAVEGVLTKTRDWIIEHKPNGMFEDIGRDPKQVEMATKIAFTGDAKSSFLYQQIVKPHADAFSKMSDIELETLFDTMSRFGIDVGTKSEPNAEGMATATEKGVTKDQIETYQEFKKEVDEAFLELKKIYPELPYNPTHYGQSPRWKYANDTYVNDAFDWAAGDEKSQLEGTKQFLMARDKTRTTREIVESGLSYETINPHEMFLKYIQDVYSLIELKKQTDIGLRDGTIKVFSDENKAKREGLIKPDDNTFKILQKMNLDFGYKIRGLDGEYVQHEGTDAVYSSLKEAEEGLKAFGEEGAVVDPVKPDMSLSVTHYSVYRNWEHNGKQYSKEVAQSLDEAGAKDWIEQNKDKGNYTLKPQMGAATSAVVAQMYMKPDLADMVNVLTSKDKFRQASMFGISGENLMQVKNMNTAVQFAGTLFHTQTIMQEAMAHTSAWKYQKGLSGKLNPLSAKRDLRDIATLLIAAMEKPDIVNNKEYMSKMKELLAVDDVDVADVLNQAFEHGAQLHQDVSQRNVSYKYGMAKYFKEDKISFGDDGKMKVSNNPLSFGMMADSLKKAFDMNIKNNPDSKIAAISKTAAFSILQMPTAWLMEQTIPRYKLAMFARLYTLGLEQNAKLEPAAQRIKSEIARDNWKFIEDCFGEVNKKGQFNSKTIGTALQFIFTSPSWKIGSIKALSKGGIDLVKKGWFTLKGEEYHLTQQGYWALGAVVNHAMTALFITSIFQAVAALTGADVQPTDEETPLLTKILFPRNSFEDANSRLAIPSYITEGYKMITHLGMLNTQAEYTKLFSGNVNGLIQKSFDIYRGEDYRGTSITDKTDNIFKKTLDTILYALPAPISVSSYMQGQRTKGFDATNLASSILGLTPAPASSLKSEATNKLQELNRAANKGREITEDDMSEKNALKRAMFAWQKGDKSKVDELLAEGRVTQRQVQMAKDRYPKLDGVVNPGYKDQLSQQLKTATIENALIDYKVMSDSEKEKHLPEIRKKYFNMLSNKDKPQVKKDEVKETMKGLGLI